MSSRAAVVRWFVSLVPQSEVWIEDSGEKSRLIDEYKANLGYGIDYHPLLF